jgi:chromosome segregation ATPase
VTDDADTAQAELLLQALHQHVEDISHKLESLEGRLHAVQGRAGAVARRKAAGLRKELYEAHRLIDGLHRRFPAVRVTTGRASS